MRDGEEWEALAPLFARTDLHLRSLTVRIAADRILPALAAGPLVPRLEKLDFAFTQPERGLATLLTSASSSCAM